MSDGFVDPYIDLRTGVLRNLVGAGTWDELRNAEGELVAMRMSEFLRELPLEPTGTLDDLRCIHRWLFRDVYDWAGEVRTIEIRKAGEGAQFFLPSVNIPMGIAWARSELEKDDFLVGLASRRFPSRMAYHYDNYNFVHPFREGNGRTQRLLWTLICHHAGYDLDWRDVTGAENDEASRLAAEDRDMGALVSIFARIAAPCDPLVPINAGLVQAGHLGG